MTGRGCLFFGFAAMCVALALSQFNLVVPFPIPPAYLWPAPLALLGLGLVPERWWRIGTRQLSLRGELPDAGREEPPMPRTIGSVGRERLATLLAHRLLRPTFVVVGAVGCACLAWFSVPPVHGVLRDEVTGKPISGATVCFSARAKQLQNLESATGSMPLGPVRRCTSDERGRFAFMGLTALFPVGVGPLSLLRGTGFDDALLTVFHPEYGAGYGWVDSDLEGRYDSIFADSSLRFGPGCFFAWDGRRSRIGVSIKCKPYPRRADGALAISRTDALASLDGWSHMTGGRGMLRLYDFACLVKAQAAAMPLDEDMVAIIDRTLHSVWFGSSQRAWLEGPQGFNECHKLIEDFCKGNPAARPCRSLL